ncbi:hypothetical protein ACFC0D_08375 [Streptomyces sp. NPDC056222]|uniref:hypothetical protein n=1 Tax=Streptomyces sp. NPDC056222 TaxID=3345749 RepID=UPI0035DD597B
MRIPGFERELESARPVPETRGDVSGPQGDRFFPQLESYCTMECRADCNNNHPWGSPEWFECFDQCMETCR